MLCANMEVNSTGHGPVDCSHFISISVSEVAGHIIESITIDE